MMLCAEVTKELERLNFEEGTRLRRLYLRFHLLICKGCKSYDHDSKALDKILKSYKTKQAEKLTSAELDVMVKRVIG